MKRQIGVIAIAIVVLVIGVACDFRPEPQPRCGQPCNYQQPGFSVSEIENPDLKPRVASTYGDSGTWVFADVNNAIYVEILKPIVGGYYFSQADEDVFAPLELPTSPSGVVGEISEGNYGLAATIIVTGGYTGGGTWIGLWERVRDDFLLHKHFRLDVQFDGDDPETGNFMERLHEEVNDIIAIARMSMELEAAADPNTMSKKSP